MQLEHSHGHTIEEEVPTSGVRPCARTKPTHKTQPGGLDPKQFFTLNPNLMILGHNSQLRHKTNSGLCSPQNPRFYNWRFNALRFPSGPVPMCTRTGNAYDIWQFPVCLMDPRASYDHHGSLGVFWWYSKGVLGCSGSVLGMFWGYSKGVPWVFWGV